MSESAVTSLYQALEGSPRLLLEVDLKPVQGDRFQPTGFPDLGPARYTAADGKTQMILIESAQSVANRMEVACWDAPGERILDGPDGLPYVRVNDGDGKMLTNSILEAHRLDSPDILEGGDKTVLDILKSELAEFEIGAVNPRKLASVLLRFDPGSLLHGTFWRRKTWRAAVYACLASSLDSWRRAAQTPPRAAASRTTTWIHAVTPRRASATSHVEHGAVLGFVSPHGGLYAADPQLIDWLRF